MKAIESVAPLRLQEEYDNAGLQVGFADSPVRRVIVSLDITEEVVREAIRRDAQMIVSHHPLIFRPLRQVSNLSWQQRCVVLALQHGIALYSAHTNLDNACGGVNHEIARRLSLKDLSFLRPVPGEDAGSGLLGLLETPLEPQAFLSLLRKEFRLQVLAHSDTSRKLISKVALCGGAGAFLIPDAIRSGADCFLTGEIRYHDFFENEGMLLCSLGHYESEQYTSDLLISLLRTAFPELEVLSSECITNPVRYNTNTGE